MEELKLLVEAVAKLPHMAIWALVVFYGYKVLIAGSIYGVIRFIVQKSHDAYVQKQTLQTQRELEKLNHESKPKEYKLDGLVISEEVRVLLTAAISRMAITSYVHMSDARRLDRAVTEFLEKEGKK